MQSDEEAIALYIKDGGRREDWPLVDEAVRLFYRLQIRPDPAMKIDEAALAANPLKRLQAE